MLRRASAGPTGGARATRRSGGRARPRRRSRGRWAVTTSGSPGRRSGPGWPRSGRSAAIRVGPRWRAVWRRRSPWSAGGPGGDGPVGCVSPRTCSPRSRWVWRPARVAVVCICWRGIGVRSRRWPRTGARSSWSWWSATIRGRSGVGRRCSVPTWWPPNCGVVEYAGERRAAGGRVLVLATDPGWRGLLPGPAGPRRGPARASARRRPDRRGAERARRTAAGWGRRRGPSARPGRSAPACNARARAAAGGRRAAARSRGRRHQPDAIRPSRRTSRPPA